jgi:2-keto-3-deoxy-L-rhamnonate aldolase RhmA
VNDCRGRRNRRARRAKPRDRATTTPCRRWRTHDRVRAEAVENADAIAAVDGIDVLHIGASDLSTEMGIPGQYTHERMRAAFETVARAAKGHGKAMGVGGVRQDFEFQSWLLRLGVRYLTGGSDVGYILSAGRADVKQLRELKL